MFDLDFEQLHQLKEEISMEKRKLIIEKIVLQMLQEVSTTLGRVGTLSWMLGEVSVSLDLVNQVNRIISDFRRFGLSDLDIKYIKLLCWLSFSGRWSRVLYDMYPISEEVAEISRRDHEILFRGLH